MQVLVLNDTRADPNPGCQATMSMLVRQLAVTLDATVSTRPRGDGYEHFVGMTTTGRAHSAADWYHAVTRLERDSDLVDAVRAADLVVANLEGTFHHHAVGALALGAAMAVAHRAGTPLWAVNGTVEAIDSWLLAATLMPAAHVAVREPRSARWLVARGVTATAAADAAFLAETFAARRAVPDAQPRAAFYTPGVLPGTSLSRESAVAGVLADLDALSAAGWAPVFVQLEEREAPLADAARARGWPTADARAVAWPAFGAWLRQFALVVSGRYHVLIFAAMAGVPAIARPSNTHKIAGLLALLDRPGALAIDAGGLSALLAAGVPAPVEMATIRRCQDLARTSLPASAGRRPSRSSAAALPLVEGLDVTPGDDLSCVLSALRHTGPHSFQTSVSTVPGSTRCDGLAPVVSETAWHQQFADAGFVVANERVVRAEQATASDCVVAAHWRQTNPLRDPAIGMRRVFSVQLAAGGSVAIADARPAITTAGQHRRSGPDGFVRFVIGTYDEFERLAPIWRDLRRDDFEVVLLREAGDPRWRPTLRGIAAWCLWHGVAVTDAEGPAHVAWPVDHRRRLLVTAAAPTPGRRRSFHGAFLAAAHRCGWRTLALGPYATATLTPTAVPRFGTVITLFGNHAIGGATRVLTVGAGLDEVVQAARHRPDLRFAVRLETTDRSAASLPDNVVALDDVACLVTGATTQMLAQAADAIASGASCLMAERLAAAAGRPHLALAALAEGATVARADMHDVPRPGRHTGANGETAMTDIAAMATAIAQADDARRGAGVPPLRVALFGASSLGQAVAARVGTTAGMTLAVVFDNDATKAGADFAGVRVMAPNRAALDAVDAVLVSSMHADAIAAQVVAAGHGHKLVFDYASITDAA